MRSGQLVAASLALLLELLADDVVAELHALVADENRGSCDELAHLVLALAAERAVQELAVIGLAAIVGHSFNLNACRNHADQGMNITGRRPCAKRRKHKLTQAPARCC